MVFKIAINGFGRIGRFVFRAIRHLYPTECQVVAIHDLCDIKTNVHLLKYDSAHHIFQENLNITSEDTFEVGEGNNKWVVKNIGGKLGPSELPWRELQVDAVLESTGLFRKHAVKEGGKVVTDGYDGHLLRVPSELFFQFHPLMKLNAHLFLVLMTKISNQIRL